MPKTPSSTTFCGVLFCDDPTHEEAIHRLVKNYHYFFVKHKGEEIDEFELTENENGDPINTKGKDHWHFVIMFPYAYPKSAVCSRLGITDNYIQKCSNRRSYLRYMTHFGDLGKKQYSKKDFYTNRPIVLESDLKGIKEPEEIKVEVLDLIIQNKNSFADYFTYNRFLFVNGYSDEVRRYPQVFRDLYLEITGRPIYSFSPVRNDNTGEVFGI